MGTLGHIPTAREFSLAAELEEAEDILQAALQAVREERSSHERYWLEWVPGEGWSEIK